MNLEVLDMPEEPTQLAGWLEQRLAGSDLPALADELSAFRAAPAGTAPAMRELLGEWQEPVLAGGLKLAPPEVVRRLLSWPERLPELQELVYMRGGRYWDRLLGSDGGLQDAVEHSRQRLSVVLPIPAPERQAAPAPHVLPLRKRTPARRVGWVVGLAAAAAAVVLAVGISRYFPPSAPSSAPAALASNAWGWNRPGVLDADGPADVYLNRLADAADEWSAEKPEGAEATAKRLNEYRRGCTALLFAEHRALSPADRQWLTDKCRKWAEKIDHELAEVEAGDVDKGRDEADAMTHQLVAALRKKAQELAAG